MASNFSQADLERMGLKDNGDGTFSKPKTVQQPRETLFVNKSTTMNKYGFSGEQCGEREILTQEAGWVKESLLKPKKVKKVKEGEPTYWKGMNIQDVFAHATANNYIFIPHNVPSSKNSKRSFKKIVLESELCVEYRKNTEIHWKVFKSRFLKMLEGKEKPYRIEMMFIRDSKRRSDYHNLVQLPMDLMVKFGWILDDNMDECVPVPPIKPYAIDKHIPGILIRVL